MARVVDAREQVAILLTLKTVFDNPTETPTILMNSVQDELYHIREDGRLGRVHQELLAWMQSSPATDFVPAVGTLPEKRKYADTEHVTPQDVIDQCTYVLENIPTHEGAADIVTLFQMVKVLAEAHYWNREQIDVLEQRIEKK